MIYVIVSSHFGLLFAVLPEKGKFQKKIKKKHWEISLFYTSVPKIMIICYTVREVWCMTDVIVNFHFGLFFAPLPP